MVDKKFLIDIKELVNKLQETVTLQRQRLNTTNVEVKEIRTRKPNYWIIHATEMKPK